MSKPLPSPLSDRLKSLAIGACERGLVPDSMMRAAMRKLMAQRLSDEYAHDPQQRRMRHQALVEELRQLPIAIETDTANEQHYEVPAEFFHLHLGPVKKYSCAYYPTGQESLAAAELAMLDLYAERAGLDRLQPGQRILELGCGWGSLSLWMAQRYPAVEVVVLSNSNGQRGYIEARAAERGITNLRVLTANIVEFDFPCQGVEAGFDRVISIEMFEHMKNYALLFERISGWMKPGAQMFVHVFAHKTLAYHFTVNDSSDWMSKYFFSGGLMPSMELFTHFQDHLQVEQQWWVNGQHYEKTSNHWLQNLDAARQKVMPVLERTYGDEAAVWFHRWRMFYMAVAELFGYERGEQWGVVHTLFRKPA